MRLVICPFKTMVFWRYLFDESDLGLLLVVYPMSRHQINIHKQKPNTMNKLFEYFGILTNNFLQNATRTLAILEFVVNEKWDELAEFVKIKLLGKLVDPGITIALADELSGTTILVLLEELEQVLKEKGITLASYGNGKFYHPDTLTWFPNAKVSITFRTLRLLLLPKGGMTEGSMIAEAKELKMQHEHSLAEYIKATIELVKRNHFSKKNTWVVGFLEEKKDDNISCEFSAGLFDVGEFFLRVDKVDESCEWDAEIGFFLSNNA